MENGERWKVGEYVIEMKQLDVAGPGFKAVLSVE